MLNSVKKGPDGSIAIIQRRRTKTIRAADGTIRSMVSLDGETWVLAKNEKQEVRRLNRDRNLAIGRASRWAEPSQKGLAKMNARRQWANTKKKEFDARTNPGETTEAWLNPVPKVGSPMLGKAKGKNQKYRRNLRRKKERAVKIMKPVHFHTCPGSDHPHWRRSFSCSCERPEAVHMNCGPNHCLFD